MELMAAIADHPAAWHVCQTRAKFLIDELRSDLPPALAEVAIVRGRQLDWQAHREVLLDTMVAPMVAEAQR